MAHIDYYNGVKNMMDIMKDSHSCLIRRVCQELGADDRADEMVAKYVDESIKMKKFKDDKGGVSAEFFKRKDKDPFGSEDSKGFNVGATFTFEGGGLSEKQAKELDFDGDGRISASDLKAKREGKFSRGGRAAIRGFKFGGIF